MDPSGRALFGLREPRRRAAGATAVLLGGCTLAFFARVEAVFPSAGFGLALVAFGIGLGIAAYAG